MISNEEKIYNDIMKCNNISASDLLEYRLYLEDNINWLYTPLVIRHENESVISSWSYVIKGENIVSSQVYVYGESKINNQPLRPFINSEGLMIHYYNVEGIISDQQQMFPDEIFKEKIIKILEKYFLEIIIQESGYRVRIRPFMIQELAYDLYYNNIKGKLSFNIFNPEL